MSSDANMYSSSMTAMQPTQIDKKKKTVVKQLAVVSQSGKVITTYCIYKKNRKCKR